MIHKKRGGALRGLRINREILILRKPPTYWSTIECKCKVLLKGTNTHTWECISTVTWVYTNPHTRELNMYRPDRTGPDRTTTTTHFKSFQSTEATCPFRRLLTLSCLGTSLVRHLQYFTSDLRTIVELLSMASEQLSKHDVRIIFKSAD